MQRDFLTSVFAVVTGLERLFHLDEMEDVGFAWLTSGWRCPSRHRVGAWRRHVPWYEVAAFCRRTSPWHLLRGQDACVSYAEHSIPRWTHKFRIPKGYVTTRNKHRRCEKLFYSYAVDLRRYRAVRATPGNWELRDVAVPLTQQTLRCGQPRSLHALFDAGVGKSAAGVRQLWGLTQEHPEPEVTVRACRYPQRLRAWKQLPSGLFVPREEPGACQGAPPKEIRLAETQTVLKGETEEQAVRTLVYREVVPGPKKERWHPLFTTSTAEPYAVLERCRTRQHQEQGYRVGVPDACLDAVPCGYDKESPERKRPRSPRGPLQLMGWLVALVYNPLADLAGQLGSDWDGSQVRTLRQTFLNRPGQLYLTATAVLVLLDPFRGQEVLGPVLDQFNAARHRIPWLENRPLVLSLTAQERSGPGP